MPILLILALMGGIALQAALPIHTPLPDDPALAPRRLRTPVPAMVPAYEAIVRAPIFAPDRGPEGQVAAQTLQLIGVAAYGRSAGSAIVRTVDGASHVLKTGDSLQGWRLIAVSGDHAMFDGPVSRTSLAVSAGPSPGAASAVKPPVTP